MTTKFNTPMCRTRQSSFENLANKLKKASNKANLTEKMQIIGNHTITTSDFKEHIQPDPTRYYRKSIEQNELFEMLILTWMPGQKSPIHNHRGSQCIVRVLQGTAVESTYRPHLDGSFSCMIKEYPEGSVIGGEDADIHTVENIPIATQPLVTLHAYFPALENMEIFEIVDQQLVAKRRLDVK